MTTRAAIYARISKDTEGTRLGVQRQETLCRQLADTKGWEVVEVYVDDDISAYTGARRPAYEAMCQAIRNGTIDAVVVVDQDRLVRLTRELEGFITLADDHGTLLANVSGDIDLSTADGRFRARMLGVVAQHESEKKSERIRRQRQQMRDRGLKLPGQKPFGFTSWKMVHDPVEADAIRDAAARVLAGESMGAIVDEWNRRGIGSGRWERTRLKRVLAHPRNIAKLTRGGKDQLEIVGDGAWEPILDRVTYERLQALFASRRRGYAGTKHLLSGLMRCGRCDAPMVASGADKVSGKFAYICRRRASVPQACGGMYINGAPADDHVASELLDGLDGRETADAAPETRARDLVVELEQVEARLVEVAEEFYADELFTRTQFEAVRRRLLGRADELRRQIAASAPRPRLSGDLRGAWERMPPHARRAAVEAAGIGVVCHPLPVSAPRRFDPSRLEIIWPDGAA